MEILRIVIGWGLLKWNMSEWLVYINHMIYTLMKLWHGNINMKYRGIIYVSSFILHPTCHQRSQRRRQSLAVSQTAKMLKWPPFIGDLWNPWIFYRVFDREPYKVQEWLRKEGILADSMLWVCGKDMKLNVRSHSPEGYTWRCHRCDSECNVRKNSWFAGKIFVNILFIVIFQMHLLFLFRLPFYHSNWYMFISTWKKWKISSLWILESLPNVNDNVSKMSTNNNTSNHSIWNEKMVRARKTWSRRSSSHYLKYTCNYHHKLSSTFL